MMKQVRRWLPGHRLVLVVDGGFAAVSLALACVQNQVVMVSRLRWDAALYHPPGPQPRGKRGPKPLKGKRQRSVQGWAERLDTPWETVEVDWYSGQSKRLWVFSRTALWRTPGLPPVAICFVIVGDPEGKLRMEAFFCTDLQATAAQILVWVVMRWSVEVTFEEGRAHLGLETQRQWSDMAIARITLALLALLSLITVFALRLKVGLEQTDHRAIGHRLAVCGAPTFQEAPGRLRLTMNEFVDQTGLPHPGLSHNPHHLPPTDFHLGPARVQDRQLLGTPRNPAEGTVPVRLQHRSLGSRQRVGRALISGSAPSWERARRELTPVLHEPP